MLKLKLFVYDVDFLWELNRLALARGDIASRGAVANGNDYDPVSNEKVKGVYRPEG